MTSSLLALLVSITAGLLTNTSPPPLPTLLNSRYNISNIATLLTSPPYSTLYGNLSSQNETPITILAPDNAAFAKLPFSPLGEAFGNNDMYAIGEMLRYHVLQGVHPAEELNGTFRFLPTYLNDSNVTGGQVVGAVQQSGGISIFTSGLGERSTIIEADLPFTHGLIHTISTFLTPPLPLSATALSYNLTSFLGALTHANLLPTITSQKDITIFAPTNDAFAALGATLEALPIPDLAELLNYHIVSGYARYTSRLPPLVPDGLELRTMQGANVTITQADNSLFVNSAKVVQGDILLENGVVHVIDNVLGCNASGVRPEVRSATQRAVLMGSKEVGGGVPFTEFLSGTETSVSMATLVAAASGFAVDDIGRGVVSGTLMEGSGVHAKATSGVVRNGSVSASASATSALPAMATNDGIRGKELGIGFTVGVVWAGALMVGR